MLMWGEKSVALLCVRWATGWWAATLTGVRFEQRVKTQLIYMIWIHLGVRFCKSGCGIKALALGTQSWDLPNQQAVMLGQKTHKIQEGKSSHWLIFEAFLNDLRGMACVKPEQSVLTEIWTEQQQRVFPENPPSVAPFRVGGTFLGQEQNSVSRAAHWPWRLPAEIRFYFPKREKNTALNTS